MKKTITESQLRQIVKESVKKVLKEYGGISLSDYDNPSIRYNRLDGDDMAQLSQYDAERFYEGFAAIQLNNKWNFINTEGQIAFNQWFDAAGDFNGDFAIVKLDGKDYTLDTKGNLTLAESRRSLSPIITESIIEKIKSECIKRIIAIK